MSIVVQRPHHIKNAYSRAESFSQWERFLKTTASLSNLFLLVFIILLIMVDFLVSVSIPPVFLSPGLEKHHWLLSMSPPSHFFSVQKPKNSTEKNPFANAVKRHSGKFSVPPEKFPDCFQTVRQSYPICFYRMRACMRQMRYRIYCMQLHAIACDKCDK